jgi:hypothetical protein
MKTAKNDNRSTYSQYYSRSYFFVFFLPKLSTVTYSTRTRTNNEWQATNFSNRIEGIESNRIESNRIESNRIE